jgi:hypothetical protein
MKERKKMTFVLLSSLYFNVHHITRIKLFLSENTFFDELLKKVSVI